MGYGFDLHEWTRGSQLDDWSNYLHEHMGWDHLLCARGHRLPDRANNMNSYDGFGRGVELTTTSHGPSDYHEVVEDLDTDLDRPPANNIPTRSTGSLQRLRACSPAASHSLHSDHCSGHCQRHSELAIPGSPILRPVLQQQLDRRALFREYQLQTFSQKVQNVISSPKKAGISLGKKCFRNKIIGNVVEGGIKVVEADNVLEKNTLR